jgi:hypothetical protein
MNLSHPMHLAPRCSATSKRTRKPCQAPLATAVQVDNLETPAGDLHLLASRRKASQMGEHEAPHGLAAART